MLNYQFKKKVDAELEDRLKRFKLERYNILEFSISEGRTDSGLRPAVLDGPKRETEKLLRDYAVEWKRKVVVSHIPLDFNPNHPTNRWLNQWTEDFFAATPDGLLLPRDVAFLDLLREDHWDDNPITAEQAAPRLGLDGTLDQIRGKIGGSRKRLQAAGYRVESYTNGPYGPGFYLRRFQEHPDDYVAALESRNRGVDQTIEKVVRAHKI